MLGVVAVLAAGACGSDGRAPTTTTQPSPCSALYRGLCQTRAQATEPEAARDVFVDRVHQPLHELASDAARADRATAARLLEAKNAVERDLAGGTSALPVELDRLLEVTRRAIDATGQPAPTSSQDAP